MKLKRAFQSPYEQYAFRNGQAFTLEGEVDPLEYDAQECGPLYWIRFEDGHHIMAWPEEIEEV